MCSLHKMYSYILAVQSPQWSTSLRHSVCTNIRQQSLEVVTPVYWSIAVWTGMRISIICWRVTSSFGRSHSVSFLNEYLLLPLYQQWFY